MLKKKRELYSVDININFWWSSKNDKNYVMQVRRERRNFNKNRLMTRIFLKKKGGGVKMNSLILLWASKFTSYLPLNKYRHHISSYWESRYFYNICMRWAHDVYKRSFYSSCVGKLIQQNNYDSFLYIFM